jgi:hypothetical protein
MCGSPSSIIYLGERFYLAYLDGLVLFRKKAGSPFRPEGESARDLGNLYFNAFRFGPFAFW